jgi:hypothetical protein
MTHVDDHLLLDEAQRLVGDHTISADVRLAQLRELVGKDVRPRWRVTTTIDKFDGDWTSEQIDAGLAARARVDTDVRHGNLLTIGGVSALWQRLIGTGVTAFSNGTAVIGVGDSSTAAADTQTDLQASTNKTYKGMDATYPLHTDSTGTAGSKTITLRATFGTSDANYPWNEWGVGNGTTTMGRMLNRKVESLGTKPNTQTWQFTVTIQIA